MKPHVRAFRNIASQVCKGKMSFQVLLTDFGLEDVLADAEEGSWSAKEIACQVLARCCITDGKFNNCMVAFLAVIQYLNEQCGPLGQQAHQAFADLAAVLDNPGTEAAIRRWFDSHYP